MNTETYPLLKQIVIGILLFLITFMTVALVLELDYSSKIDLVSISIADTTDFVCPGECTPSVANSTACPSYTSPKPDSTCGNLLFRCCPNPVDLSDPGSFREEGETCDPKYNSDGSACDGAGSLQCVQCLESMKKTGVAYCVESTSPLDSASGLRKSYIRECGGFHKLGDSCENELESVNMPGSMTDLFCKDGKLAKWLPNDGQRKVGDNCNPAEATYTCISDKSLLICETPSGASNSVAWRDTGKKCTTEDSEVASSGGGTSGGGGGTSGGGGGTTGGGGGGTTGGGGGTTEGGGGTTEGGGGGTDPADTSGSCPATNVQFEQGEITKWVEGSQLTKDLAGMEVPIHQVHVNCFKADGSGLVEGAIIKIKGPGYDTTANSNSVNNIPSLTQPGTFTASCILQGKTCDSDSFQVGGTGSSEGGGGDPNQVCPGTNLQFERNEITEWVNGAALSQKIKNAKAPISNIHINCFTRSGAELLQNGAIKVTGPGGYKFDINSAEARSITPLLYTGQYTATCMVGETVCDTETFQSPGDLPPTDDTVCGPIDTNSDGKLTLVDLSAFAKVYGKPCGSSDTLAKDFSCGPQDSDNNGKIDLVDLSHFASFYNEPSCSLEVKGG